MARRTWVLAVAGTVLLSIAVYACIFWLPYRGVDRSTFVPYFKPGYEYGGTPAQHRLARRCARVLKHPRRADEAALLQLIQHTQNEKERLVILSALAVCGGERSAPVLKDYYDGINVTRRNPPPAAFELPAPYGPYAEQDNHLDFAGWDRSKVQYGDALYSAVIGGGPQSLRDILLCTGANQDGSYSRCIPTGLLDSGPQWRHWAPWGAKPETPIKLSIAGGVVSITYNEPGVPIQSRNGITTETNKVVLTSLALEDLRRDSDGDGLTDVTEKCLTTDPARPDTDGDGLADLVDPHPLADPAKMDYVARGVARALDYVVKNDLFPWFWYSGASRMPYYAEHYLVTGIEDLAWAPDADTYGIAITGEDRAFPMQADNSVHVFTMEELKKPRAANDFSSRAMAQMSVPDALDSRHVAYVVDIEGVSLGFHIVLCDVNGELYPAYATMTWIE